MNDHDLGNLQTTLTQSAELGYDEAWTAPAAYVAVCTADYSYFIYLQTEAIYRVRVKFGLIFFGSDWAQDVADLAVDLFNEDGGGANDRARRHRARKPTARPRPKIPRQWAACGRRLRGVHYGFPPPYGPEIADRSCRRLEQHR